MWLMVDFSYLLHKAHFSFRGDFDFEDYAPFLVCSFFDSVFTLSKRFETNKILICKDSRRSYRKQSFPAYKEKRKTKELTAEEKKFKQEFYRTSNKILSNKNLRKLGFQVFSQKGLEADDMIASISDYLTANEERGIIVTTDADLYQCLNKFISIFDLHHHKIKTWKWFQTEYKIMPPDWAMVKAIGGCKSDEVPGLSGVGESAAIDYINGQLPEHYKKFQTITNSQEKIKFYLSLVKLPHEKTDIQIDLQAPVFSHKHFYSFFEYLGLGDYIERNKKAVESFLNGRKVRKNVRKRK